MSSTIRWADPFESGFANHCADERAELLWVQWITTQRISESDRAPLSWTAVNSWRHGAAIGCTGRAAPWCPVRRGSRRERCSWIRPALPATRAVPRRRLFVPRARLRPRLLPWWVMKTENRSAVARTPAKRRRDSGSRVRCRSRQRTLSCTPLGRRGQARTRAARAGFQSPLSGCATNGCTSATMRNEWLHVTKEER